MHHPYQCLAVARRNSGDILVVALGPNVLAFDVEAGHLLSQWPEEHASKDVATAEEAGSPSSTEIITGSNGAENDQHAKKKRKIAKKPAGTSISPSTIAKLVFTSDYKHIIAATGEDKGVHVLSLDEAGQLKHLSHRRMPKRPSAISITSDDTYILCGDKFGDVYSLPLHPPESDSLPKPSTEAKPKVFKPSANELTIHSGRNRRALESQIKQAQSAKPKEGIEFAHELLLGHVSMLTDLACVTVQTDAGNLRNYILTADRDEHIRVSRGMPQAHIIETFCLGHASFISKLCLLSPTILVSGGGDDDLYVWDWQKGVLLYKLNLRKVVEEFWEAQPKHTRHDAKTEKLKAEDEQMMLQDSREAMGAPAGTNLDIAAAGAGSSEIPPVQVNPIAVSGLWAQETTPSGLAFYCALDSLPAVMRFTTTNTKPVNANAWTLRPIVLPGNPLDVVILGGSNAIVAVDNIHEAGSTKLARTTDNVPRLHVLNSDLTNKTNLEAINAYDALRVMEEEETTPQQLKRLGELFYGVENLRKRGGWGGDQDIE